MIVAGSDLGIWIDLGTDELGMTLKILAVCGVSEVEIKGYSEN
jgi:hypothetical protein